MSTFSKKLSELTLGVVADQFDDNGYSGYSGDNYWVYADDPIASNNVYNQGYWEIEFNLNAFSGLAVEYHFEIDIYDSK